MRVLQTYALLFSYGTVFGADDPPSSETVSEEYAATQTTTITFPILTADWATVAQCWNQEKILSEIQNRVPKCVEHGKIAENVGKVGGGSSP